MKQIGSVLAGLAVALTLGACGSNDAAMKAPSSVAFEEAADESVPGETRGAMELPATETAATGEAARGRENVRGSGQALTAGRAESGNGGMPSISAAAQAPLAETQPALAASSSSPSGNSRGRATGPAGPEAPPEVIVRAEREAPVPPIVPAFPSRMKHRTLQGLGSVFFGFDRASLSSGTKQVLDANIAWMKAHPGVTIRLAGHADERGTSEYNLGLGMHRGNKVREYLVANGISGDSLVTVSYGEEMPLHRGHDEQSWRQNRRVEFSRSEATVALVR